MSRQAYERYWADPQSMAAHIANLGRVYDTILSDHRARLEASAA